MEEEATLRARVVLRQTARHKEPADSAGLLTCAECGAHYVIAGTNSYACSSYVNGRACTNNLRVRRDQVERLLLDPDRERLLAPDRVNRMARQMQRLLADRARAQNERATTESTELQELDARIARLRARRATGDPDMTDDELAAAIDRAAEKRRRLLHAPDVSEHAGKLVTALPNAAELYRRQIAVGLDGNPREAAEARRILREILGGKVPLARRGRELWAQIELRPEALLLRAEGTCGSGGPLSAKPSATVWTEVKVA